jgi:hypothetical protein
MIEVLLFDSGQISVGLILGPHKVRFELADPAHQAITSKTMKKVTNYGGSTLIPPRTLPPSGSCNLIAAKFCRLRRKIKAPPMRRF